MLEVFLLKSTGGVRLPVTYMGSPEFGYRGGVHNVALIQEDNRSWLLETSLWQAHRPHFGDLPPMMVIDLLDEPCDSRLPLFIVDTSDRTLEAQVNVSRPDGTVELGWKLMPARRSWRHAPDASVIRARTVAEVMMQRMAA